LTRRTWLKEELSKGFVSLQELAYSSGLDLKDLVEDFHHVKLSAEREGLRVEVKPPRCKGCGFVFEERVKKPSKCPRCRHERVEPAKFRIAKKEGF